MCSNDECVVIMDERWWCMSSDDGCAVKYDFVLLSSNRSFIVMCSNDEWIVIMDEEWWWMSSDDGCAVKPDGLIHHHSLSVFTTHASLRQMKGANTEWPYEFVYYCTHILATHAPSLLIHSYYTFIITTHFRHKRGIIKRIHRLQGIVES